ncbi:MAG: M1 family metallopeptidase [Saprospiraceae bacterium]|nr:M1 family metallopeptidase [Saprospiraceae bacterium]
MFVKFALSLSHTVMRYLLFALFCFFSAHSFAQNSKPYFQQEVNYRIVATLDDVNHTLKGELEFEYVNNSPDELPQIWVHLWANAFKNRRSAYCKQKLRDGDGEFYFAEDKDLGGYKNLDFNAEGQKISWKYDPKNPDIAVLTLPKALAPGKRIHISTPFLLKIPASFSRLGHVETSYQMTQWYPKPAVYDHKGWHAMPYLDIGEFYSEFGSFDVTLSLPENYVVGATGVLQTPSEIEFLHKKEAETRVRKSEGVTSSNTLTGSDAFPASSLKMKTIRYTAERVHDFAWFADKRFLVLKDTARLASGKMIDCWAMFPPSKNPSLKGAQSALWEKGAFYVRRSVEFYSEKVGEYPWPQATAVHSALSAGGGMEYPMITVIGDASSAQDLDDVITHEVGHNWFYGILASNERDHPFLDEGINSYYEARYMKEYYGTSHSFDVPKFILNEKKQGSLIENGLLFLARNHQDTPPNTHSNQFSPIAYGLQVYMKTAQCIHWLEQSVGTEKFDAAMQEYYRKWQFRHPYPEDFKAVLEEKDLNPSWFFEAMQTQKQVDFKLKRLKKVSVAMMNGDFNCIRRYGYEVVVKNKGNLSAPFSITSLKNGEPVETIWFPPISAGKTQNIEPKPDDVDAYEIDYLRKTLDINRKNNSRSISGLFPGMRPFEFRPLAIFQNARRNTLAALPWVGWNNYDKTMLGLLIYNPPLPQRKLQYYLLPGYATGSKSLVGLADVRYKFYPGGLIPKVTVGVGAKTFDFGYNAEDDYYSKFYRIAPQVTAELRSGSMSFRHALNFRILFIGREDDLRNIEGLYLGKSWKKNTIYELRYEGEQFALPNPYRFQIALETQDYRDVFDRPANYLRSTAEWRQKFFYKDKKKLTMRMFAGYFIQSTQRNRRVEETALSLNPQGFNDYKFDQTFLARSGADHIMGRQVSQTEGGFKGAFGEAFAGVVGNSNNFMLSLNLKADLPVRLPLGIPLKPYFDLGYFDDATTLGNDRPMSEQLLWSGGLMLEFFKGGLEVYFPLANSKTLKNLYCEQAGGTNASAIFCGGDYRKMISWSMRLNFSDPAKMVENMVR